MAFENRNEKIELILRNYPEKNFVKKYSNLRKSLLKRGFIFLPCEILSVIYFDSVY